MSISRRQFLATTTVSIAAAPFVRLRAQGARFTPVFAPVRRNVSYFTGSGGTIGYLVNDAGVIVVDSQYPDPAKAFLAGLEQQTGRAKVDVLINTHHHADHTGGNPVFKGVTTSIVAQAQVPALQKAANDAATTPAEQACADTTFVDTWNHGAGDEMVHVQKFTPAHTGGDAVVYFEKANVVHVGDLVWNSLQTFVDRPGGASALNWIPVLEQIAAKYPADAMYLCGHAKTGLPVTLAKGDVLAMRDYMSALVDHVRKEKAAGKSRDEIVSSTALLPNFEARGPLTKRALEGTYDEIAGS